jgi:hypothetical protein
VKLHTSKQPRVTLVAHTCDGLTINKSSASSGSLSWALSLLAAASACGVIGVTWGGDVTWLLRLGCSVGSSTVPLHCQHHRQSNAFCPLTNKAAYDPVGARGGACSSRVHVGGGAAHQSKPDGHRCAAARQLVACTPQTAPSASAEQSRWGACTERQTHLKPRDADGMELASCTQL